MELFDIADGFADHQINLRSSKQATGSLSAIKDQILVLIPGTQDSDILSNLLIALLSLIFNAGCPEPICAGAFLSLLVLFTNNPTAALGTHAKDSDTVINTYTITEFAGAGPVLMNRDQVEEFMTNKLNDLIRAIKFPDLFVRSNKAEALFTGPVEFKVALNSILIQIWNLLAKSITASNTAEGSEDRRTERFEQEGRIVSIYELSKNMKKRLRETLRKHMIIKKTMVSIMQESVAMGSNGGELVKTIAVISHYVVNAGLTGFFQTIKYGINTRSAALAVSDIQAELGKIKALMQLYKKKGENAPYMVILDDSDASYFAPAAYPMIWSFAMGYGTAVDTALAGVNYNRSFLDSKWFAIGQKMAVESGSKVNVGMLKTLGLTEQQGQALAIILEESKDARAAMISGISGSSTIKDGESFELEPNMSPSIYSESSTNKLERIKKLAKEVKETASTPEYNPRSLDDESKFIADMS
ncbi:nucleocapsid protein [Crotalus paramyxovirus]|nr:nucleocapsid protein [Crotalus paramyxovirus]